MGDKKGRHQKGDKKKTHWPVVVFHNRKLKGVLKKWKPTSAK